MTSVILTEHRLLTGSHVDTRPYRRPS